MAAKPESLIVRQTSNLAESFMKVRTAIDGNKAVNRGQRDSWQHRCHAAVLEYNRGIVWVTDLLEDQYHITKTPATENFIRGIKITISHLYVHIMLMVSMKESFWQPFQGTWPMF